MDTDETRIFKEQILQSFNPIPVSSVLICGSNFMTLSHLTAIDFDLEKTLNCGQVFHWEKSDAGFVGAIGDKATYVEQRADQLHFAGITAKVVANYFSLDHSLANIC